MGVLLTVLIGIVELLAREILELVERFLLRVGHASRYRVVIALCLPLSEIRQRRSSRPFDALLR
jgi:hypothetical protein